MSFEEIAQNITTTGYISAIVGVLLCIAVLMIRFRARNLVLEKERAVRMQALSDEKRSPMSPDDMQSDELQNKSSFKTFVPEDAE